MLDYLQARTADMELNNPRHKQHALLARHVHRQL
jgi:hypothetical protein